MGFRIDRGVLVLSSGFMLFLWLRFFNASMFVSILSVIFYVLLCYVVIKLISKDSPTSFISLKSFYLSILLKGNQLIGLPLSRLYGIDSAMLLENALLLPDRLVFFAIKSSNCSAEDLIKAYKLAIVHNKDKVEIIHAGVNRNALSLFVGEQISFKLTHLNTIYNKLKNKGLLPIKEKRKQVISLESIKNILLNAKNLKFYFYSAIVTLFLTVFSPFKLYYLIFATANLLLALITLVLLAKESKKN